MLPFRWRQEADRLDELTEDGNLSHDPIRARIMALRQCSVELENRLRWSGMLDP